MGAYELQHFIVWFSTSCFWIENLFSVVFCFCRLSKSIVLSQLNQPLSRLFAFKVCFRPFRTKSNFETSLLRNRSAIFYIFLTPQQNPSLLRHITCNPFLTCSWWKHKQFFSLQRVYSLKLYSWLNLNRHLLIRPLWVGLVLLLFLGVTIWLSASFFLRSNWFFYFNPVQVRVQGACEFRATWQ